MTNTPKRAETDAAEALHQERINRKIDDLVAAAPPVTPEQLSRLIIHFGSARPAQHHASADDFCTIPGCEVCD